MTNRLIVVLTVVSGAACSMSVKDDFLAELPDVPRSETADATVTTADSADDTGVASEVLADVPTETTTDGGQTEVITADVVTDAVATETVDAADTSATTTADADATSEVGDVPLASDVVIGPDDLAALGWHSVLPSGAVVGAPIAFTGGVAVPIVNGTAVELRAFGLDGSGKFAATIFIGSAPTVSGGVFCGDGNFYVSGNEPDGSKAFVAKLAANGTGLKTITFFPKADTTGGSTRLEPARCGGPAAYVQLEPVGAITYKANNGGTVQLTADQTLNRSFLVDLTEAFGDVGRLATVSADKIRMIRTAVAEPVGGELGHKVFYVGEARVEKQLNATTLQPGDQLIYARDYDTDVGGTATATAFYGDNDIRGLAVASDGRFAAVWRAVLTPPTTVTEEQRVTAFDAEGKQIGTAVVNKDAPIVSLRWAGDSLILAGTYTGAPPFPGDNGAAGTWLAVMQVGTAMTVTRSAAFSTESGLTGGSAALHRVVLAGDCDGDAWAVVARGEASWRVVALGDDGADCRSGRFDITAGGSAFDIFPLGGGDYGISTDGGVAFELDGGAAWPGGLPTAYLGLVRARAGATSD